MRKWEKILKLTGGSVSKDFPFQQSYDGEGLVGTFGLFVVAKSSESSTVPIVLSVQKYQTVAGVKYAVGSPVGMTISALDTVTYSDIDSTPVFDTLRVTTASGLSGEKVHLQLTAI